MQVPVLTESLDVRDAAAIEALPGRLPQEFAEVDILVNNAGLALGTAPVTEISTEVRLPCYQDWLPVEAAEHSPLHTIGSWEPSLRAVIPTKIRA